MARILYGLCGVGIGHAVRTKLILEYLKEKKHEFFVITSGAAYYYLSKYFENVYDISGFELVFKNNKIMSFRTLFKNLTKFNLSNYKNIKEVIIRIDEFKPEIVISDWETVSSFYAKNRKLQLISIDNQGYTKYGDYDIQFKYLFQYWKARFFLKTLVKNPDYNIVMLLPGTKLKNIENVFGVSPLIREDIKNAKRKIGNHILVYDSTRNHERLIKILREIKTEFIVYGYKRIAKEGNIEFKGFDDTSEFVRDLATCRGVITNAGFTLINEAIYLEKPLLCVPIRKHFEQILNALYVEYNNYGESHWRLSVKTIKKFIKSIDKYHYERPEYKDDLYNVLDSLLEKVNKK
jgi:uncharacterized protein (TIGR00661 family)